MRYAITIYRDKLEEAGFKWETEDGSDPLDEKFKQLWNAHKHNKTEIYGGNDTLKTAICADFGCPCVILIGEILPEEMDKLRSFIDSVGGEMELSNE